MEDTGAFTSEDSQAIASLLISRFMEAGRHEKSRYFLALEELETVAGEDDWKTYSIRVQGATITVELDGMLVMEFTDNGAGMDEATLERIFDPFFTTKELGSGTGLGLSSVRQMMTEAKGQIDAMSSLGEGTTITLRFPVVDRDPEDPGNVADESTTAVDHAHGIDDAQILVIEDDVDTAMLIADTLTDHFQSSCVSVSDTIAEALKRDLDRFDMVL